MKKVWKAYSLCTLSLNYTFWPKDILKVNFFSFPLFPPPCRRKGRYLNFQMDLLLQERLSNKKGIMLDLNLRELEGVFTSLNTSYCKERSDKSSQFFSDDI